MSDKFCKDCEFYKDYFLVKDCVHPASKHTGLITGKVSYPSPQVNRGIVSYDRMIVVDPDTKEVLRVDAKCGKDGKLFKKRDISHTGRIGVV